MWKESPHLPSVLPETLSPEGDRLWRRPLRAAPRTPSARIRQDSAVLLPPPAASLTREAQSQPGPAPRGALVQGDLAGK